MHRSTLILAALSLTACDKPQSAPIEAAPAPVAEILTLAPSPTPVDAPAVATPASAPTATDAG